MSYGGVGVICNISTKISAVYSLLWSAAGNFRLGSRGGGGRRLVSVVICPFGGPLFSY